jgi:hypothetical protein
MVLSVDTETPVTDAKGEARVGEGAGIAPQIVSTI